MKPEPSATGSHTPRFSIRERIEQTRSRVSMWLAAHQAPQTSTLLLPAPKVPATILDTYQQREATFWERNPPHCPNCDTPMIRCIFGTVDYKAGEYFCGPCHQLNIEARIMRNRTGKLKKLFAPGELMRLTRAGMQDAARREIIASYSTQKDLTKDAPPIIANLQAARQSQQTGELPARDIERANSAKVQVVNAPATPIPQARETLFADVPDVAHDDDENDATEKRAAVKLPATTQEMRTEALLFELMHGKTHEQSTGENERVTVAQSIQCS